MKKAKKAIEEQLEALFWALHAFDESRGGNRIRFLVMQIAEIEIRMDGDKNHVRPHVHIKYKKDNHAASYAIDDGSRLVGELPRRYDRIVSGWILSNQADLRELWASMQRGNRNEAILMKFQATVVA